MKPFRILTCIQKAQKEKNQIRILEFNGKDLKIIKKVNTGANILNMI